MIIVKQHTRCKDAQEKLKTLLVGTYFRADNSYQSLSPRQITPGFHHLVVKKVDKNVYKFICGRQQNDGPHGWRFCNQGVVPLSRGMTGVKNVQVISDEAALKMLDTAWRPLRKSVLKSLS